MLHEFYFVFHAIMEVEIRSDERLTQDDNVQRYYVVFFSFFFFSITILHYSMDTQIASG